MEILYLKTKKKASIPGRMHELAGRRPGLAHGDWNEGEEKSCEQEGIDDERESSCGS